MNLAGRDVEDLKHPVQGKASRTLPKVTEAQQQRARAACFDLADRDDPL